MDHGTLAVVERRVRREYGTTKRRDQKRKVEKQENKKWELKMLTED